MAIAYDGINYFPVGVNFMEENAMEVIEAKYGIKGSAIVLKLLCKIYKEGYFIRWDEEHILLEDIIKKLDLGVLVISNAALGSINNCVLTISYLKQKNIPVRGIILNNYDGSNFMQADNKRMMEEITAVPVLACVPPNASELDIDVEVLKGLYK